MSAEQAHLEQVGRNTATRAYLQAWGNGPEWVVTIAFYEALHLIEAILAHEGDNGHAHNDHSSRNRAIMLHPGTRAIAKTYLKLYDMSIWARYLEGHGPTSYNARSPGTVSQATGVYLKQIRDHARGRGVAIGAATA